MVQGPLEQNEIHRELVSAAIQTLKQKGADINPYTVASEAKIPRSAIYRNADLMDLISQETGNQGEPAKNEQLSEAGRVFELEERVQQLDQAVWELEKQNEELYAEVQNAWTMGFAAGLAEASRRQAEPDSPPLTAEDIRPDIREDVREDMHEDIHQDIHKIQQQTTESERESAPDLEQSSSYPESEEAQLESFAPSAEAPVSEEHLAEEDAPADESLEEHLVEELKELLVQYPTGELSGQTGEQPQEDGEESLTHEPAVAIDNKTGEQVAYSEQVITGDHPQVTLPVTNESALSAYGHVPKASRLSELEDGIYNVARSGPYVASDFNPLLELSWKDLESVYNYRVSNLMNYARNVPQAARSANPMPVPGPNQKRPKLADFIDPDILAMLPSDEEIASLQNLEAAVYMSNEETEVLPLPSETALDFTRTRSTSTAHHQGNDLSEHGQAAAAQDSDQDESILDLDLLDIFGGIEDLEKLHAAAETPQTGDELRQLIQGRIQQASEIHQEQTPRPMGGHASPSKDAEPAPSPRNRSKFVGGKAPKDPKKSSFVVRSIPPEIRKASLILGLRPEELTNQAVLDAWKKQIASPGVHPDLGGDTEAAVYLNTAKDTLIRWIDAQAPKLGKKFGSQGKEAKPPDRHG